MAQKNAPSVDNLVQWKMHDDTTEWWWCFFLHAPLTQSWTSASADIMRIDVLMQLIRNTEQLCTDISTDKGASYIPTVFIDIMVQ